MLRRMLFALKSAISLLVRVLERGWDGVWRFVLSPVRALVGEPALQPEEVADARTEAQVTELLEDELAAVKTMSQAQSSAKLAAIAAERQPAVETEVMVGSEAEAEPEPKVEAVEPAPSPDRVGDLTWMQQVAIRAKEMEEVERRRGEAIRHAMVRRDLTTLPEEERAALEGLDEDEWEDLVKLKNGYKLARQVDVLVRGYAQLQALHARLEREGKLGDYPQPAAAPAFGM